MTKRNPRWRDWQRIATHALPWSTLCIALTLGGHALNTRRQARHDASAATAVHLHLATHAQTLFEQTRKGIETLAAQPGILKKDDHATRRLFWGVFSMIEHLGIDTLSLIVYAGPGPEDPAILYTMAPYFKKRGDISDWQTTKETRDATGFTSSRLFNPVEENVKNGIIIIAPIDKRGAISALIDVDRFTQWIAASQPGLAGRLNFIVDGVRLRPGPAPTAPLLHTLDIGESRWAIEIAPQPTALGAKTLTLMLALSLLSGFVIAALRYALQQRRIAKRNFETLVNTMQSAVLTIGGEGRINFANPYAQRLLGAPGKELLGLDVFDSIVPAADREGARSRTDLKSMLSGISEVSGEVSVNENVSLAGERMWLAWTNRKIIDADGTARIVSVGNDVTKQKQAENELAAQKKRADELLYAILPKEKVAELKANDSVAPKTYGNVAVLFTDVVGFTSFCDSHPVEEVVAHLQEMVGTFEEIVAKHKMEKIKTIGDAFMAVGGLLTPLQNSALTTTRCAFEFLEATRKFKSGWQIRAGIHIGPVQAGVIGKSKFLFDTFGDTVNTASRMESNGLPGKLTVSADTWKMIQSHCTGTPRQGIQIKGKGEMKMFVVDSIKP